MMVFWNSKSPQVYSKIGLSIKILNTWYVWLILSIGLSPVLFSDWEAIDEEEQRRGCSVGKPREKIVLITDMMNIVNCSRTWSFLVVAFLQVSCELKLQMCKLVLRVTASKNKFTQVINTHCRHIIIVITVHSMWSVYLTVSSKDFPAITQLNKTAAFLDRRNFAHLHTPQ